MKNGYKEFRLFGYTIKIEWHKSINEKDVRKFCKLYQKCQEYYGNAVDEDTKVDFITRTWNDD